MGMPNRDSRPVAACELNRTIELSANIRVVLRVIQEDFALNYLYTGGLRSTQSLAIANGHAVEEIEIVALQRLHHFLHAEQAGRHRAAHVVVQPNRKGNFAISIANNALDLAAAHVRA